MDSPYRLFTDTSGHIRFLLLVCVFLHFLVVGSVRWIELTHVGFRAHVKIASRVVSYRIVSHRIVQPRRQTDATTCGRHAETGRALYVRCGLESIAPLRPAGDN